MFYADAVLLKLAWELQNLDLIVLNLSWVFSLGIVVWCFLSIVVSSCFVFLIICSPKYLRIERHLAAKFGTNIADLI
jgi:hypothetical protein